MTNGVDVCGGSRGNRPIGFSIVWPAFAFLLLNVANLMTDATGKHAIIALILA